MKHPRRHAPARPARPIAADLHVHTTHSDGACSPGEVVQAAANLGLAGLAITDHDTLSALAVARPEAARLGIELIAGVELTAEFQGRDVHVLGYFVDDTDPDLLDATRGMKEARSTRLSAIVDRLERNGLVVDLPALGRAFPRATLGRRHLADWLSRTGQVAGHREAFERFLGDERVAGIPKPRLPWREAVSLIRGAGGVAALAHPPHNLHLADLLELSEGGLRAIEVDGPGIAPARGRRWRRWADELGLVPVAGSDFHSPDRPGRWLGSITTPGADLDRLRRASGVEGSSSDRTHIGSTITVP